MTTRTPNDQFKALVAESGLTYEALAKAVCAVAAECGTRLRTNKSNIEHWIGGSAPRGAPPLSRRRPSSAYARIVALDLVAGAELHLKRGSIEQACATWHQAIDHMSGVRSVRTRKAVSRMRGDLARFRASGLRCVAELDERGREFLAGT
ncbi:hypothetical protein ACFQ8S_03110 [Streptomyces virginiae]|uniref:hypothetical protein n=1 Tax=Streptomyces virginiae TaxID=1961 RepID=UPI0036847418